MAYSPIEQGRLARDRALAAIAKAHGATSAQIALAFVAAQPRRDRDPEGRQHRRTSRENRAAADIVLDADDLAALDAAFPPPAPNALEMI